LALGIVVAVKQEDLVDASCYEPAHLPDKENPRLVVAPVSVIEIACDDDERGLLMQSHKVFKRLAGCCTDTVSRAALLPSNAYQRAVEMNVCGVDKPKGLQGNTTDRSMLDANAGKTSAPCRKDDGAMQASLKTGRHGCSRPC